MSTKSSSWRSPSLRPWRSKSNKNNVTASPPQARSACGDAATSSGRRAACRVSLGHGTLGETPLRTPNDASPRVIEQMVRQLVGMMGAALGAASSSGPSASACPPMYLIHVYLHMSAPPAHSPASPEETVCIICMDEPRAIPRSCMAIRATFAAASSGVCSYNIEHDLYP